MRNSNNVFTTFDAIYGQNEERLRFYCDGVKKSLIKAGKPKKLTVKQTSLKVSIPYSTVDGCRSVIVPVDYSHNRSMDTLNNIIMYIIQQYFDLGEPVVILLAEPKPKHLLAVEEALIQAGHPVLMYDSCGGDTMPTDKIELLKKYLHNPSGILLTGAETFNGMQARNVVVVAGSSKKVRNYILRGISQVVFVQNVKQFEPSIYNDTTVQVDRTFLPSNIRLNEHQMKRLG